MLINGTDWHVMNIVSHYWLKSVSRFILMLESVILCTRMFLKIHFNNP